MEAKHTATRIYLITFQDGGWIKAELSSDIAKALDEANAEYGDVSQISSLPDTDAAVMKFVRAINEFDARGIAMQTMTAKAERLEGVNDDLVKLVKDAQAILASHVPPGGPTEHETISALLGLLDGPQSRAALTKAQPAPAVPDGWRERLCEMDAASYTYSQYPDLAHAIFDSVINALDELERDAQVAPAEVKP